VQFGSNSSHGNKLDYHIKYLSAAIGVISSAPDRPVITRFLCWLSESFIGDSNLYLQTVGMYNTVFVTEAIIVTSSGRITPSHQTPYLAMSSIFLRNNEIAGPVVEVVVKKPVISVSKA
jgi:hypothetical protein